VIRAAKGEARQAVIDALLAQPDARIVPMLSRILEDSDPLGVDHEVVLQTLSALAAVRADRGVPAIRQIMRSRRLFAWNRTRAIAHASVHALAAIGSPAAQQALDEARRSGHRALRRAAQVAS
jgi:HEAT repeat protein